jgi:hypothetical protein
MSRSSQKIGRAITRALLGLSLCLATTSTTASAGPKQQPEAAPASAATGSVQLTGQTPVVGPDGKFAISAVYRPAGNTPQAGSETSAPLDEVSIAVYERVTDRSSLIDSLDGLRLGSPISLTSIGLGTPDSTGGYPIAQTLNIGTCETCVPIATDGVYPVSVDVRRKPGGSARAITHMLVQQSATQPRLDVALIIPITVASTLNVDGTNRAAPAPKLVAASESLASYPGIPLSVVLTPSVIDRAQSDVAIRGTLDTLGTALDKREILATPYESLHPRIQRDGRLGQILLGQWRQGAQVLESRFGDVVTSDTWVVQPNDEIPDRDGLGRIAPQRLIVDGSRVARNNPEDFVQNGIGRNIPEIIDTPLIFDTGVVFEATSNDTVKQSDSQEDSSAITSIVTDPILTNHLRADNPILGVSALLADLTLRADVTDTERPGIAVAVPPEAVTRQTLDRLLTGIAANKGLQPVIVSSLFELPIGTTDNDELISIGRRLQAGPALTPTYLTALDTSRRKIDGAALMIGARPNEAPTGTLADRLFSAALANPNAGNAFASETDPESTNRPLLVASTKAAEETLAGVGLAAGGPFRLTALRGKVPITIENPTGGPIVVHLSVEQSRVRLTGDSAEQDITVEQATQVVLLNIETLSSGRFDVRVVLTTPNGVVLARNAYTVRSTGVSGVGVTLTLTLLILLGLWWLSSRRSAKKAAAPATNSERLDSKEVDAVR